MTKLNRSAEVLTLLKRSATFVSGAKIASALGITRAAVWKKICRLRDQGYRIEAFPARGYRLAGVPEFSLQEIQDAVGQLRIFSPDKIHFYEKLASTNATAVELANAGCPDGTIVVTDAQSAGRGRMARTWSSPPGVNIYMSIILRPTFELRDAAILTLLAGVACARALRHCSECEVSLRWPNDLLIGTLKVGGILTELRADPDRIQFAVIGIGINVNYHRHSMPDEIQEIATSVAHEAGKRFSRSAVLACLIREMDTWLNILAAEGKRPVLDAWLALSSTIGKTVTITTPSESLHGRAETLDDEGFLLVRLESGALQRVHAGDVAYV